MRLLRLAAFACVATVLSLASHLLAGGAPPTWWATLVACAIPAAARAALVRRRRGLLGIGIVLGAVRVILHEIFTASAMPAAGTGMCNSMNAGSGVLDDAAAMHPGGDFRRSGHGGAQRADVTKDAREFATVRWVQRRFRPARGSAPEGTTMRNLMGQLDGTVNPVPGGAEFDAAVWTTGPGWFAGGTVLVLRRGKLDRLRGNGFGVLGLVQSIGDLGASLVVGLLWAAVSPTVAFGYAAAWMAASLLASGLLWAPAGPTADTPDRVG